MIIDIENGFIDFGLIKVTQNTNKEHFDLLPTDCVKKSVGKRGDSLFVFKDPIVAGGVSMRASAFFHAQQPHRPPSIEFRPYGAEDCKAAFHASHKWLEAILGKPVETKDYILAIHTPKLKLSSTVTFVAQAGFDVGGSVSIVFR